MVRGPVAEGGDGSVRGGGSSSSSGGRTTVTGGLEYHPTTKPGGNPKPGPSDGMAYYPKTYDQVTVDTSTPQGIANASNYGSPTWNQELKKGDTITKWTSLPSDTRKQIDEIAKGIDYRKTGKSLWEEAVNASELSVREGAPKTPWDFINGYATELQGDGKSSGGGRRTSGGSTAYTGPVTSTSWERIDRATLTDLADQIGRDLLGRNVTKEEMDRIEKRVKKYEQNHPSVNVSQGSQATRSSDSQQGASNSGRQDIVEKILTKNPDFIPYQMDTTVMDAMLAHIKRGKEIANG